MSLLGMRRPAKSLTVTAAAVAALFMAGISPAAAAVDGATGQSCSWNCGRLTNSTAIGLSATLEWGGGSSDEPRWRWERWVPSGTSLGGNASRIDVDGVYVPGGCVATGVVFGVLYNHPVVWGAGWHKISGNENAALTGIVC